MGNTYTKYGVLKLDSVEVNNASVVEIDVNQILTGNPENHDLVDITGALRLSADDKMPKAKFLDENGNAIGAHYSVTERAVSSVTEVSGTTSNTEIKLLHAGVAGALGNAGLSIGTLFDGEFFNFKMSLMGNRNSSAPISRAAGWWISSHTVRDGYYGSALGCFYLYEDKKPFSIQFGVYDGSTNISAYLTSYAMLGNRSD